MSCIAFSRRSISAIKVDQTDLAGAYGKARIAISWFDGAGAREQVERHGPAAQLIIQDLQAVTLVSEEFRQAYLIGFIRCHSLRRETD